MERAGKSRHERAAQKEPDPIDRAIQAATAPAMVRFPLTFGSEERAGQLVLPADISAGEIIGLLAFIAGQAAPAILAQQSRSRIVRLA